MADIETHAALTGPTGFLGHNASVPGTLTPNVAQKLLWSATRRVDVVAENNLTLSSSEVTEGVSVHAEINAAITAMNAAGGGIVYLQPGVYWISASIQMQSLVHLYGSGYGCTVIKLKAGSNTHCIVNATSTSELYSIGRLRVDGNRNGQGIPAASNNIWVCGIYLVWGSGSGFSFTDPQCYFYDLYVNECNADCYYMEGRGGHIAYNLHGGGATRWGANLQTFDSQFHGVYIGGCGADGIRTASGPIFLTSCKSFFTGQRTLALSDALLRPVHASSPITPSGEDWRYGAGFRITGAVIMSACESQDTCGHGVLITANGVTVNGHRFGNIGALGRHYSGTFANEATLSDIACVMLGGNAFGNYVSGVISDQYTENAGEQPQCDWLCRIDDEQVRGNTIDIGRNALYLRMSGGRFTKTVSAKAFLANDIRIGDEQWQVKIADFTAVKADHRQTWYLKSPIATITAVAATVGNGWAVRLINKSGATVTAGGQSVTNNQDGVLSSDGATFTWTNAASLSAGRVRELLAATTLTVEDNGRLLLCKAVLTITGTAANLGDGFRCVVHAQGGAVTWGSVTITSGNIARVEVTNGAVLISQSTPATA